MDETIPRRPGLKSRDMSPEEQAHYQCLIDHLRDSRHGAGLSQAEMDDMIGVSEGMVAKWESKSRLPGAFFLMCWCKSLGLQITVEKGKS